MKERKGRRQNKRNEKQKKKKMTKNYKKKLTKARKKSQNRSPFHPPKTQGNSENHLTVRQSLNRSQH